MTIPSMSISERYELSRLILDEEKRCFHPDAPDGCSPDGPIKSHSVSKGTSLAAIAEDGYVTSIAKPFQDIVFDDQASVKATGVKISSIFPGFCRKHDSDFFSLVETEEWDFSRDACFLLSYRSLANTVLRSKARIRYIEHMNDIDGQRHEIIQAQGFSDDDIKNDQDFMIFARRYLSYAGGSGKDMQIDDTLRQQYVQHAAMRASVAPLNPYLNTARFFSGEDQLGLLKFMFLNKQYDKFRYVALKYSCILPFVTSKTIKVKNREANKDLESFVNLNVCSNKTQSFIVFGWIEDGGIVEDYLKSMILNDDNKIINNVLSFLFKNSTNTFFSKRWWDSLSEQIRHTVISYHADELNAFPEREQSIDDYQIYIPEFSPTSRIEG